MSDEAPKAADPAVDLPLELRKHAGSTSEVAAGGIASQLKKLRFLPVVLALVFLGGIVGLYFQPPGLKSFFSIAGLEPGGGSDNPIAVPPAGADSEPKPIADLSDVVGLGRLVPRGEVITLAAPYGAGDARIDTLSVAVGDRVEAGQVVATLDSLPDREDALASARANVALREATLAQTKVSVRASKSESSAALSRVKEAAAQASAERERTERLFKQGVATQQELSRMRSEEAQALQTVAGQRATLARFSGGKRATQSDVLVAMRNLESAQADLDRAQRDLAKAQVKTRSAGVVLDIFARPGEKPGSAGILSLGDIDEMRVEVEVYQAQIHRVALEDSVEIVAEVLPDRLTGKVERIGLTVGRQSMLDDDPAANTDARVVKVTVVLDDASARLARGYTDLQVVARIRKTAPGQ